MRMPELKIRTMLIGLTVVALLYYGGPWLWEVVSG